MEMRRTSYLIISIVCFIVAGLCLSMMGCCGLQPMKGEATMTVEFELVLFPAWLQSYNGLHMSSIFDNSRVWVQTMEYENQLLPSV